MNNHLSQDQLSMWILGRCTPEELRHGRECPQCRARLALFEGPVSGFRSAILQWSNREKAPQIEDVSALLRRPSAILRRSWAWVAVGMAVLLAIPIYRQGQALMGRETGSEVAVLPGIDAPADTNTDALFIEAVNAHLSRTIPAPMEPILVLIPTPEHVEGGTK